MEAAVSRCGFDAELKQFERDIRRDRKSWDAATVLAELRRHAQSWATGKADPKPQQPQIKQPQQNIQNPPGTKQLVKLAKAQSLALAAVNARSPTDLLQVAHSCWLSQCRHHLLFPTPSGTEGCFAPPSGLSRCGEGAWGLSKACGWNSLFLQTCRHCLHGSWRYDGPVPCHFKQL